MVDYSNIPRDSRRVPLETRVQFKFDRFSGFISEYSSNISPGGMFIRTYSPEPAGRILDFEFHLGDGFELIKGRGEVVWNRARDEGAARPAGMGIRFLELSQESKDLIYRIVDAYVQEGGIPFDVSLVPPDPIPLDPLPRNPTGTPSRAAVPAAAPPSGLPAFYRDLPPEFAVEEEPFQLDPLPAPPPDLDMSGGPPFEPTGDDLPRAALSPTLFTPPPSVPEPEPPTTPASSPFYLPGYLPEASAPREEPSPLANYAGSASAPQQRPRRMPWLLLGLALVVLVAALSLMRDRLLGWAGLGDEPTIAQAAPTERPRRPQAVPPPPQSAPAPQPAPAPALEAVTPPAMPAPEQPAGPPARALERITWEQVEGGGTQVVLQGDGRWAAGRWSNLAIEGNPPREVIKLSGMGRPYPSTRLVAGTPELLQVRTGYHPGQELHVVLDLANPRVQVAGVEPVGDQLRILLRTRDSR